MASTFGCRHTDVAANTWQAWLGCIHHLHELGWGSLLVVTFPWSLESNLWEILGGSELQSHLRDQRAIWAGNNCAGSSSYFEDASEIFDPFRVSGQVGGGKHAQQSIAGFAWASVTRLENGAGKSIKTIKQIKELKNSFPSQKIALMRKWWSTEFLGFSLIFRAIYGHLKRMGSSCNRMIWSRCPPPGNPWNTFVSQWKHCRQLSYDNVVKGNLAHGQATDWLKIAFWAIIITVHL